MESLQPQILIAFGPVRKQCGLAMGPAQTKALHSDHAGDGALLSFKCRFALGRGTGEAPTKKWKYCKERQWWLRMANKGCRNDRPHTCWGRPRVPAPDIACPKLCQRQCRRLFFAAVFLQGPFHLLGDVDTMTRFVRSNKARRESIMK